MRRSSSISGAGKGGLARTASISSTTASRLNSAATAGAASTTIPEVTDPIKLQKLEHYESLVRLETQHNSGNVLLINGLQEPELKELITSVEAYVNQSLHAVLKNDYIFGLASSAQRKASSQSTTTTTTGGSSYGNYPAAAGAPLEFKGDVFIPPPPQDSTASSSTEPVIAIDSVVPLDFLRNGLRSGPLVVREKSVLSESPTLLERTQTNSTIQTGSKQRPGAGTADDSSAGLVSSQNSLLKQSFANVLTLKYLLAVELDRALFDVRRVSERELLHSIRLKRKPAHWLTSDYEQLTVELDPLRQAKMLVPEAKRVATLGRARSMYAGAERTRVESRIDNNKKRKVARYLNSKAVLDRLYKHFCHVLYAEWPGQDPATQQHHQHQHHEPATTTHSTRAPSAATVNPPAGSQSTGAAGVAAAGATGNPRSSVVPESKSCSLRGNQLRINFKWRGLRLKEFEVSVILQLAVRFDGDDNDDAGGGGEYAAKASAAARLIANAFIRNGGFFRPIPEMDEAAMRSVVGWTRENLRMNMNSVYLYPNGVHHYYPSFQVAKLNLLRFLCWVSSFNAASGGLDAIVELLGGNDSVDKSFFTTQQAGVVGGSGAGGSNKPSYSKQSSLAAANSSQIAITNSSHLLLLLKCLQVFNHLTFQNPNIFNLAGSLGDDTLSDEDVLVELVLLEAKENFQQRLTEDLFHSFVHSSARRVSSSVLAAVADDNEQQAPPAPVWSNENFFDRLWSCLFAFRASVLNSCMRDSFDVYSNALPLVWQRYIGLNALAFLPARRRPAEASVVVYQTAHARLLGSPRERVDGCLVALPFIRASGNEELELKRAIESGMKLLLNSIISDHSLINSLPDFLKEEDASVGTKSAAQTHRTAS